MVVCMSERREGHNATRRQTMKRWKVALVAVLTIAMVMQSSNVQAIAEGIIADATAAENMPIVSDTMPTDGTGTEDVTTDETAEDTTSTDATTPETDEAATDTEATEEESTDAPAAPEEVVEDTTEAEAPAETPAEEADTTVTLNVEISGAKLTYTAEDGTEQNVTPETDPKSVDVPNTLDFKFTVIPDDGQQIASVKAVTSDGVESDVTANESGEYTLPAANVTDGTTIKVTTEAVPEPETPAEEETPETDTTETDDTTVEDETVVEEESEAEEEQEAIEPTLNSVQSVDNSISLMADTRAADYTLEVGDTTTIQGEDGNNLVGGASRSHRWTVSGDAVDFVGGTSKSSVQIRAVEAGAATVTHTYQYKNWLGGKWQNGSETFTIQVNSALKVTIGKSSIEVGDTTRASAQGAQGTVTWTSSNDKIATVSSTGLVTGVAEGDVEIIATDSEGTSGRVSLSVTPQRATVTFDLNDASGSQASWAQNPSGQYEVGDELWLEDGSFTETYSFPSRQGYVFAGWDKSISRIVTGDVTYTAKWVENQSGKTPVYVYTQVTGDGDTSDLVLNKDGWYTIGVIFIDSDLLSNPQNTYDAVAQANCQYIPFDRQGVTDAIYKAFGSIERYQDNQSISIDDLSLRILKTAGGASDYVATGTTWHLDCTTDIKALVNYTVEYREVGTNKVIAPTLENQVASDGSLVPASRHQISIRNYTYAYSKPQNGLTVTAGRNNVLTLYYTSNRVSAQVTLDDWVYGDTPKQESASVSGGDFARTPDSYEYYAQGADGQYTEKLSGKPSDAGDYMVKAIWDATENNDSVSATDTFTISPRPIVAKGSAEKVYDGNDNLLANVSLSFAEVDGNASSGLV